MTGNRSTSADTHNGLGGIRRAATNFGGFKKANSQIKNKAELLIYKDEKFVKQVKIILVGHYIFYYKNNRVYSNNDINKNTDSEKKEGNEEKNPEERKNKNEDDNASVGNSARPKTIRVDSGGGFGGVRRAVKKL